MVLTWYITTAVLKAIRDKLYDLVKYLYLILENNNVVIIQYICTNTYDIIKVTVIKLLDVQNLYGIPICSKLIIISYICNLLCNSNLKIEPYDVLLNDFDVL